METQEKKFSSFFRGISLSDYMRDISCPEDVGQYVREEQTNDLFLECEPQAPLANYVITQIMDEQNYDQHSHQDLIVQPLKNFDLQRGRVVQADEGKPKNKGNIIRRSNQFQMKNNSNSAFKEHPSTKKQMFQSLYGHAFRGGPDNSKEKGNLLSTLGMGNWRGRHKSLNKKELQIRDKNRRQYQQLIKYENVISQRLDTKLNSIRIDGVKDKIHDRNQRFARREARI